MVNNEDMERKTKSFNFASYHNLETVSTTKTYAGHKNDVMLFKCLHLYYSPQIYAFMDTLVASHPNLISKVHIGSSYENRPMYALKVESDSTDYMIEN